MRAAQIHTYGDKDAVTLTDIPKITSPEGTVVVKVFAAGVNPIDWKIRSGHMAEMMPLTLPVTLGLDFSGIVVEIGEGVENFSLKDEVYGQAGIIAGGSGSFAEFARTPSKNIAIKPKTANHLESASLPLAGVSAVQGLLEHIKLQRGQKILIHGGAGGIGSFAIELAHYIGTEVYTTAHNEDAEYLKKLGADHVIDHRVQKFEDVVKGCDAVLDTVGGQTYMRSFGVLKKGGTIVSLLEAPNDVLMEQYGVTAISQFTQITTKRLERLAELVDLNVTKVHIDKVFPLEEAAEALDYLQNRHQHGKVVLHIQD
ncbi:hypothetical protein COV82_05015 [Candidatus Peregrinibacteria bacterium CG11_big_fil_rev_8_21_14_0_20_46_8]|nr:MAG: hypothetical protein COV82_05015 [Candidatus Peregrinibacteria bacterium CG11_big_fil_rev_8_21_14_0_20_46_8]